MWVSEAIGLVLRPEHDHDSHRLQPSRRCACANWSLKPRKPIPVALHAPGGHSMDEHEVNFRWNDYQAKGRTRHKTMTLTPEEFMR